MPSYTDPIFNPKIVNIKSKTIDFELKDGKYYIVDTPLEFEYSTKVRDAEADFDSDDESVPIPEVIKNLAGENLNNVQVHHLMGELKKAYTQVLHEKEDQILQLKEEITDLKTLVKVLEERG